MKLTLYRCIMTPTETFGILVGENGVPLCLMLEEPWRNNEKNHSCIPAGTYNCIPNIGKKKGWRLENVPGRSDILIHAGNTVMDTEGCILPGKSFGYVDDLPAVMESGSAMLLLKEYLPDSFTLEIKEAEWKF